MRSLLAMAFIAFPLTVLILLDHVPASTFIALFGVLAGARLLLADALSVSLRVVGCIALGMFCAVAWQQQTFGLIKLYPVLMSLAGAGYGLFTLLHPPSAIERLARATGMSVDAAGQRYTRGVTWMWVGFFVLNAGAAAYTAMATTTSTWALYNGFFSYLIIAALFAAEYLFRGYYRRQQL